MDYRLNGVEVGVNQTNVSFKVHVIKDHNHFFLIYEMHFPESL